MRTPKGTLCMVVVAFLALATAGAAFGAPPQNPKSHVPPSAKSANVASKTTQKPAAEPVETAAQRLPAVAGLPVRRVILYKSGVGYFEHVGEIHGNETVRVDFTSNQLNDVLQSLTILDLGGGRITGVDYNSDTPFAQQLGSLRLPLAETTDISKFYSALRGARLEVHAPGETFTGRLLSVERKTRTSGGTTLEVDLATLVSDSGEVRSVELTPAVDVRLADSDVTGEVNRYLSLLASQRQQDLRRMTIQTAGAGDRQLYVSYISEVPIWKTSYRIVMPSKPDDKPLLQGWAIVDNTVGQDWDNVELSLVAGAPQSFIQQLSQPYYARRPVVPLPQYAQLTPQIHESASGEKVEVAEPPALSLMDTTTNAIGSTWNGLPPVGRGVRAGVGYGVGGAMPSAAEKVEIPAAAPMPSNSDLSAALRGMQAAASGSDLGDLFQYKLKDRVTIHKNESALVPILQSEVTADKVSLWNAAMGSPRPLRAIWLTNSTPLTLDGGSFSVIEDNAFAGEGLTDPIKPGEKRLLSYAADLGVRVNVKMENNPQSVRRVLIAHGMMVQTKEFRQDTTYEIQNDDVTPRTLLIEHPKRAEWTLSDETPKPEEQTAGVYRFQVHLDPKAPATLDVRESQPSSVSYSLTDITDDQVALFVHDKSINPEIEAALRKILAQKDQVSSLDDEVSRRNDEVKKIYDDQQRIRENLKALKGTPEERALTQRYTQQLNDQETRLATLQKEIDDFHAKRDQAQAALDKMIQDLSMSVTL